MHVRTLTAAVVFGLVTATAPVLAAPITFRFTGAL
jgi:hypothetical protein